MSRVLPGAKQTLSQKMLTDQLANGQNNFVNPSSALYDVNNILLPLLRILVIVAASVLHLMLFLSSSMICQKESKNHMFAFLKFVPCLKTMATML